MRRVAPRLWRSRVAKSDRNTSQVRRALAFLPLFVTRVAGRLAGRRATHERLQRALRIPVPRRLGG